MWKYTVGIDGMMCNMCEAHMNDAVRKNFSVKKVKSDHGKKQTVIVTEEEITDEKMREVVSSQGYDMLSMEKEPYKKKGLFGRL